MLILIRVSNHEWNNVNVSARAMINNNQRIFLQMFVFSMHRRFDIKKEVVYFMDGAGDIGSLNYVSSYRGMFVASSCADLRQLISIAGISIFHTIIELLFKWKYYLIYLNKLCVVESQRTSQELSKT